MELFFGRLGVFLVVEDNEGRARSLTIEFFHEDACIGDLAVTVKELDDVGCLDFVGQSSHYEGPLLVVRSHVLG